MIIGIRIDKKSMELSMLSAIKFKIKSLYTELIKHNDVFQDIRGHLCGLAGSVLDHRSLCNHRVRILVWAYLKVVSPLTWLHYLWRSLGPFSLQSGRKTPIIQDLTNKERLGASLCVQQFGWIHAIKAMKPNSRILLSALASIT